MELLLRKIWVKNCEPTCGPKILKKLKRSFAFCAPDFNF